MDTSKDMNRKFKDIRDDMVTGFNNNEMPEAGPIEAVVRPYDYYGYDVTLRLEKKED